MKAHSPEILKATAEYAAKYLRYDPESGKIFFKISSSMGRIKAGGEAGKPGPHGYLRITLFFFGRKVDIKFHRMAWLIHYGEWPSGVIDHIDHDKLNNRISNLRDVTNQENIRNSGLAITNTSGYTGVTWNKTAKKWQAQFIRDKKLHYLGVFADVETARQAVISGRLADGFHENHGESF